ncbi:MAG: superoxide dismutase, Ni [Sulfurovum sp.]|nr:superoxide dismutase, Ni [Sulfurovum sp.]
MFKIEEVKAHCDVPCGIYDPSTAQIAALSVIRMIDLIDAAVQTKDKQDDAAYLNNMTRYIMVKETEAVKCKEEIRIIWGDFIKPPHLAQHKDIHAIVHNIMMLGGAVKQHTSREKAVELLQEVNKFAKIFWAIKGVETKVSKSPYAPMEDVVYPVL